MVEVVMKVIVVNFGYDGDGAGDDDNDDDSGGDIIAQHNAIV